MGERNSATVLAHGRRSSTAGAATAPRCLRKNPSTDISDVTSARSRPSWTERGTALSGYPAAAGRPRGETLGQRLADRLEHALGLERLDHEVARAELDRLEHLGLLAQRGAHDHAGARVELDDLLEGGEAVLLGHRDVEGGELGLELLEAGDRLIAVAGLPDHLVAALGQRVADHLPHERGIVDYQDSGHRATSIPESALLFVLSSTCSMRTAQSVSSTTTRRPVANNVPLTYRSIGSSAWRSSSTIAPPGSATTWAEGMRARPSSAHTRTGMPASEGLNGALGDEAGAPGIAGAGATSAPRSSSALDIRTTNALGTSWT